MSDADEKVVNMNSNDTSPAFPRENMVTTAVSFLQNSRVRNSPLSQKRAFLVHKGLTNEEIDIAIEKSGIDQQLKVIKQENNPVVPQRLLYSNWTKWREMWSSVVILGVTFYGAYRMYKHYIEPKIYGKPSKSKEELEIWSQLAELNTSLANLKQNVINVQESLIDQQQHLKQIKENCEKPVEDITLTEIKTEITSIKALLLSRHQFPASRVSNPSIPSWQMVESDSQNEITSVSISEVESSGICSTVTLTSQNDAEVVSENAEVESKEVETLLESEQ